MSNFIKLHVSLFQHLKIELKKKRTSKELLLFFKNLTKTYIQQIIQLIKNLFVSLSPSFRKQKAEYDKRKQARKDLQNAWKLLQWMIKRGGTRQERKLIQRDFEKHGMISNDLEKEILRELYGVKEMK